MRIRFFVPGVPRPQGSKRAITVTGKAYSVLIEQVKGVEKWRRIVGTVAGNLWRPRHPVNGKVHVQLEFIMPWRKAPDKVYPPDDLDKLIRAVLDSMTGIVYVDDSQVTTIEASKRRALQDEEGGVWVLVANSPSDASPTPRRSRW